MSTAKTAPPKAKISDAKEAVTDYLDTLIKGQEQILAAIKGARARGVRVTDDLTDSVAAGQRDIVELGKRLVRHPTDYSENIKALLDSATGAQERALELAKQMYREQCDLSSELRELFTAAFESSKIAGKTARGLATAWVKSE